MKPAINQSTGHAIPLEGALYQRPPSALAKRLPLSSSSRRFLFSCFHLRIHPSFKWLGWSLALLLGYIYLQGMNSVMVETVSAQEYQGQTTEEAFGRLRTQRDQLTVSMEAAIEARYLAENALEKQQDKTRLLEASLAKFRSEESQKALVEMLDTYEMLDRIDAKINTYQSEGLVIEGYEVVVEDWKARLLQQDFASVQARITEYEQTIEQQWSKLLEERAKQARSTPQRGEAATALGKFSYVMVKAPINGTRVHTVTNAEEGCVANCPVHSVKDYVTQHNGFAGIQGSYFCPPEYGFCRDEPNHAFGTVYESGRKEWLDFDKRLWNRQAAIVFENNRPRLYRSARDVPVSAKGISAGIINYPALLDGGEVVVDNHNTDQKQRLRATRGAFAFDGADLYLVVIYQATLIESAHVLKALGATHALTLDGGGSTALFRESGYLAGPGRPVPNAIVLK